MATREEIREGIAFLEYEWAHPFESKETLSYWWKDTKKHSLQDLVTYYFKAKEILKLLDSQGVVIKVGRELPLPSFENSVTGVARFELQLNTQREMLKVGYVAVESLIKEGEDD